MEVGRAAMSSASYFQSRSLSLGDRSTSIAEVIRHPPSIWQATDAAKSGMGGVIFDLTKQAEPIVLRQRFPADIQSRWVSDVNPRGEITNSDTELCGVI